MITIQHEAVLGFLKDLGIAESHYASSLALLAKADSRYIRDLKLNVNSVLQSQHITKKESYLLALAVAANEHHEALIQAFSKHAAQHEATEAEIAEVIACVGVMNVNNVLYRFRHFMKDVSFYENQPAGVRMSVMMNPILGKEFFELMSLAISALNGCERCVVAHEQSVKQHGAEEVRIFDAIRLTSVIKSLTCIL